MSFKIRRPNTARRALPMTTRKPTMTERWMPSRWSSASSLRPIGIYYILPTPPPPSMMVFRWANFNSRVHSSCICTRRHHHINASTFAAAAKSETATTQTPSSSSACLHIVAVVVAIVVVVVVLVANGPRDLFILIGKWSKSWDNKYVSKCNCASAESLRWGRVLAFALRFRFGCFNFQCVFGVTYIGCSVQYLQSSVYGRNPPVCHIHPV